MANIFFENMEKFKYFEMTVSNQNLIPKELRKNLIRVILATIQFRTLSSLLLSKSVKIKNTQNYNFACSIVWCETWSVSLREEHKLKVF
jgi:hypothetical protein